MAPPRLPMPDFLRATYTEEQYNAMSRKERLRRRNGQKDRSKPHIRKPIPEGWTEEDFLLLSYGKKYHLRHPEYAEIAYEKQKIRNESIKREDFSSWSERKWEYHLWREYRLTLKQYWELYDKQSGVCSICNQPESYILKRYISKDEPPVEKIQKLSVDHDHETGLIRGLLCFSCNKRLHSTKDGLPWLRAAIQYLDESENNDIKLYISPEARQYPKEVK
jgi:hypothetical protein